MLESKFASIVSKSSTDVGQTNLYTLDVQVTEGSPVFVKQYTIPLKYQNCTLHGCAQETRLRQTK